MSLQSKLALHDFAHGWDLTTNNAGFYWFRALVRIRGGFHIQEETEVTIRTMLRLRKLATDYDPHDRI